MKEQAPVESKPEPKPETKPEAKAPAKAEAKPAADNKVAKLEPKPEAAKPEKTDAAKAKLYNTRISQCMRGNAAAQLGMQIYQQQISGQAAGN